VRTGVPHLGQTAAVAIRPLPHAWQNCEIDGMGNGIAAAAGTGDGGGYELCGAASGEVEGGGAMALV